MSSVRRRRSVTPIDNDAAMQARVLNRVAALERIGHVHTDAPPPVGGAGLHVGSDEPADPEAEPFWLDTDGGVLFVWTGTGWEGQGRVEVGDEEPVWPAARPVWVDTSVFPTELRFWSGAAWVTFATTGELAAAIGAIGAVQTFTPTFAGITVGNGVATGRFVQVGKLVKASMTFTLGTTSSMSGWPRCNVPVAAVDGDQPMTSALSTDTSAATNYVFASAWNGAGQVGLTVVTGSALGFVTNSSPVVWTTGDVLRFAAVYEAA